jgi:hypothetical protein
MIRTMTIGILFFLILCSVSHVGAEDPVNAGSPLASPRLAFEASGGYYYFPGVLFKLGNDITEHPDHLTGSSVTVQASYRLNPRWAVGVEGVRLHASGQGPWARPSLAEELVLNEVMGEVTGKTTLTITGAALTIERQFRSGHALSPFLRFGVGAGVLDLKFRGHFVGVVTSSEDPSSEDPSSQDPITIQEPAEDAIRRVIPLVTATGGIRYRPTHYFGLVISGYWNTGYGARGGIEIQF